MLPKLSLLKKRKSSSKNSSLHLYLQSKVRKNRGETQSEDEPNYSFVSPEELFQQFVLSGLDYKGQLSSGYNDSGYKGTISVKLGVGVKAEVPGLEVKVGAHLDLSASLSKSQRNLIVIHRQCGNDHPLPICLMRLVGNIYESTAAVRGDAGLKLSKSKFTNNKESNISAKLLEMPEEKCLSLLSAEATVDGGLSYKGQYLVLGDEAPSWHTGILDSSLLDNFTNTLGSGKKDDLKKEVLNWLTHRSATYENLPGFSLNSLSSDGQTRRRWKFWQKTVPTDTLIEDLENFKKVLEEEQKRCTDSQVDQSTTGLSSTFQERIATISQDLRTLSYYNKRLGLLKGSKQLPAPPPLQHRWRNLCQLSLWGHAGTVDAGVKAQVSAGTAKASASAGGEGLLKYTSYRFQSFTKPSYSRKAVVLTQDTVITYRQVQLTAEAIAKVTVPRIKIKKSGSIASTIKATQVKAVTKKAEQKAGISLYNMMTYQSAIAFWHYPAQGGLGSVSPSTRVETLPGSGICFGASVTISRLLELARVVKGKSAAQYTEDVQSLLTKLSGYLHVSEADLVDCFKNSWFSEDDVSVKDFPTDVVLIESSFAATTCSLIATYQSEKYAIETDLVSVLSERGFSRDLMAPEAIRIRYRIADCVNNTRTKFKLGATITGGPGIKLEAVDNVGAEGIVDLHTHWIDSKPANQSLSASNVVDLKEVYNKAVPPVILLHQ